jgi:tetratricopeptide (TPR) repeat protein
MILRQVDPMIQSANVDGQGNVIVQIEGDRNTVNLRGLAHLTLTRFPHLRDSKTDADLLSPYSRSIELVGREQEMADLHGWLQSDKRISVRVLIGQAGAGKTRLALDLCECLEEPWDAGFVRDRELQRFFAAQNLSTWGWQRPTLVVIDYAATHAEALHGWLGELSDYSGPAKERLRLLLLERHAEASSGWWQTVLDPGGFGDRGIERLLQPAEPIKIEPITGPAGRRKIVEQTLRRKAADPGDVDTRAASDRQLAGLSWGGEPLFLMMAAMMAADVGMANALSLGRTDLALELAKRELKRIARIGEANGVAPEFLQVMAGYVTLCRGLQPSALREAVKAERTALDLETGADPRAVSKLLCEALPGPEGSAWPILPDIIGEGAVLRAFKAYDDGGTAAIQRAFEQAGQPVAATVIRTAQDFTGAGYEQPLAWLDELIERGSVDVDQLVLLANTLPENSFALAEHAARLTQKIVAFLRDAVAAGELHRLPALATALSNLGVRLREVGQHQEALGPAKEAVAIRRELAAKAPDAYRLDLASDLHNLANHLSEAGQRQEALGPANEAVSLYRDLTAKAPDAYRPALAMALNNLAVRLSEVGQHQEALTPAEEAAGQYRALAAKAPHAYRPVLASALNNLANCLSEIGQRQEALGPAQEAADLYRALAAKAPDAYRPNLASALNTMANRLGEVGHRQEALDAAYEAVRMLAPHFLALPEAYASWMMTMGRNYLKRCEEVGREPDTGLLAPVVEVLRRMQRPVQRDFQLTSANE